MRGGSLGPLDGTIVSIKDLFDVAGEPTRAGSKILAEEAVPAVADATVVRAQESYDLGPLRWTRIDAAGLQQRALRLLQNDKKERRKCVRGLTSK